LNIELPYNSAICLWDICPKELKSETGMKYVVVDNGIIHHRLKVKTNSNAHQEVNG
jgi:hypothetical protein